MTDPSDEPREPASEGDDGESGGGETGDRESEDGESHHGETDENETDSAENYNVSDRFDRLPATEAERTVEGRPTREEVVDWWVERFGIDPETLAEHTFWEKGNGKIWALAGDAADPIDVEAVGMTVLRTRQEHWKPTTNAVQRFGDGATKNVIDLGPEEARAFVAGEDREIERWDGDWGYLIAAHELAGERAILGVGLYVHGELRSRVPKGRRRDL